MKRLLIAWVVLALTGCASYTAKPIDPGAQQTALESRRLDAPDVRRFIERASGHEQGEWPPTIWDLNLLTLAAYYYHPDLDQAQARRLAAEAAIVTAGGRPNPSAGISVQRSENPPADTSPWTRGLSLDVPIETAGKRDIRVEEARYRAEAARLREADSVWQVRRRVRSDLLAVYPIEALANRQRDLQGQITAALERRFAAGYASQPDVTQARLVLSRATLALREEQKRRAENLARLAAAVGVPAAALADARLAFDVFNSLPAPETLPSAATRRQALLSRPDALAALADYEAAQSALQLEIAKQYPDFSLGPGYTWDQGQMKWSLGLSLVLPLLNRNEGPIAEARARREEAAKAFLAVQARAIAEVDEALAGYRRAVQMFDTAEALLRSQQKAERSAAAAFRAGETDRLAWLSAQYETVSAELDRAHALIQVQQSLGKLEDALRRPVGADAPAVSAARVISSKAGQEEVHP